MVDSNRFCQSRGLTRVLTFCCIFRGIADYVYVEVDSINIRYYGIPSPAVVAIDGVYLVSTQRSGVPT